MMKAFVLGKVTPSKENVVVSNLRELESISEAHFVYGKYDVVAKIDAESLEHLNSTVLENVRQVPDLEKTQTLIVSDV